MVVEPITEAYGRHSAVPRRQYRPARDKYAIDAMSGSTALVACPPDHRAHPGPDLLTTLRTGLVTVIKA